MTANAERGEYALTLAGTRYVLRPSYAAIREIEEKTGKPLFQLAFAASGVSLRLEDAGIIAATLIRAGAGEGASLSARGASAERIGELIYEEGAPEAQGVIADVLKAALSGGVTASGEAKPVANPTTGTDGPATGD